MWQDRAYKADEPAMLKAQAEIFLDQTGIAANIREVGNLHQRDSQIKGSNRVELVRALLWQIMAYSFVDLFFAIGNYRLHKSG